MNKFEKGLKRIEETQMEIGLFKTNCEEYGIFEVIN